ncbi:hypothetical protein A3D84_00525 [Candidatus Woesebacteria bacterium RIFCSPHIGHO2_02_FULL_42_20]|uniref:Uncharacterized protein n=1 Tax=Candidatus Woesebacteria bacterium RIFCSPHIGHO2_12_FULL_41_24 TaxID=1802510 RepID=A0A1F8AV76_9BACT|nr:MAG: hypothetical protein A2873_02450 [Candidatus Woesebacteria bacterium RIFCSPHIGHO2_01_FULL_42_80]OGM35263.1 MAG: hypothetical protein A3D84_00525 [Candidatus Woesebacteria bacterium RIFCSPHIGHO2_02_FULL_42_20]OGM55158.1 MAG: hypothetical protein A3E44_04535 [Candidatus Woesebacteria bacterium RIFCSPHIGHO2_12_FULL_41_24]OGM67730.1 MAG: hypothetical protein A2969_02240 [Candidatus Woesebacteria bacterium RIFCSPLOWO2_01_FULL_42_67]OGM70700.1 MAG: hypothetical protein A3I55_02985 [Candidatus
MGLQVAPRLDCLVVQGIVTRQQTSANWLTRIVTIQVVCVETHAKAGNTMILPIQVALQQQHFAAFPKAHLGSTLRFVMTLTKSEHLLAALIIQVLPR